MNILGLNINHNASASLMIDGKIVGAIQEERFTKRKNQTGYPRLSIESLLNKYLGGSIDSVDKVVIGSELCDPYWIALDHYSNFGVRDYVREMHEYWKPFFYGTDGKGGSEELYSGEGKYWREKIRAGGKGLNHDYNFDLNFVHSMNWGEAFKYFNEVEKYEITRRLFGYTGEVCTIKHHTCHAYYALYGNTLPVDEITDVLVATADSEGDSENWSIWLPRADGTLERLASGNDNHVARIYKFVTLLLGMKPNEHEYKVMGLSGYSKSRPHIQAVEDVFFDALDFQDGGFIRRKPLQDSYFDLGARLEGFRFDNIASAVQNWATEVTCRWLRHWLRETGRRSLCFSGGLSMNIKMNGVIAGMPELDWLSVPASGGDESLSLGACYAAAVGGDDDASASGSVAFLQHVYLGDDACGDWREGVISAGSDPNDYGLFEGATEAHVAKMLAGNLIIARCVGASEFGARALGNRSILANPSHSGNLKCINDAIKNRDFWMPFTPSILEEYADQYLLNPKGLVSSFMTIGFETAANGRAQLAAALHPGDYSARPQFVSKQTNPEYWGMIEEFRRRTGIPALLNTSLNLHGEPMNYTLSDAARTLALSDLNYLIMPGGQLLYKLRATDELKGILELS